MAKKKKSPQEQIKEKFITELDKLMPGHYGAQFRIFSLVEKYYEPKIYLAPEILAARKELAKMVHEHYSPGENKPSMQELLDKADSIVKMA